MEKKVGDVDKKPPKVTGLELEVSGLETTAVFNTKIGKVERKIPGARGLVWLLLLSKQKLR